MTKQVIVPGGSLALHPSSALPPPAPGQAAEAPFLLQEQVLVNMGKMRLGVVTLPRWLCDIQSLSLALMEAVAHSPLCVGLC